MFISNEEELWKKYKDIGPWKYYRKRYLLSICFGVSLGGIIGKYISGLIFENESTLLLFDRIMELISQGIVTWVIASLIFMPFAHHEYNKLKKKYG